MNDKMLDYLMSKMDSRRSSRRDSRGYGDSRGMSDSRGYEDSRRDMGDYRQGDSQGNVDFEDSRYNKDAKSYRDSRDMRDYHHMPRLSKTDIHHWKQMMENEDGSRGPHYDMQQIMQVSDKLGIKFDEFDEKEFCIAVNMMYSDYCNVAKKYIAPDKELVFFAELAKAFLEDEDGPEASEKLALYFHCIVDA